MTPFRHLFNDFKEVDSSRVLLGNDHEHHVKGIGFVKLSLLDVILRVLDSVRLVLDLKRNFILLDTLDAIGKSFKISDDIIKVMKGSRLFLGQIELMVCVCCKVLY